MKASTSSYQEKEAAKNRIKAESESFFSAKIEGPVQMDQNGKTENFISEEKIKTAIDEINPDENSMESRG